MGSSHFRKTKYNHASVLERAGNYQGTCRGKASDGGYNETNKFPDGRPRSEVHHIVCEHSIEQRFEYYPEDEEIRKYIENCLWVTPWDINNADNLVGLPRNRRFRVDWQGTTDETQWTPNNLPSHQVDHNTADGYTHEVGEYLYTKIWEKIQAAQEKPHETELKLIKTELENAQTWFLGRLKARGIRPPGQVEGWKHRYDTFKDTWYIPFSMGAVPRPRNPGAKGTVATGALTLVMGKLA